MQKTLVVLCRQQPQLRLPEGGGQGREKERGASRTGSFGLTRGVAHHQQ